MKLWELKKYLCEIENEINGDAEVVIQSIISGEERYCSETSDISFEIDYNSNEQYLMLVPKEVEIIE